MYSEQQILKTYALLSESLKKLTMLTKDSMTEAIGYRIESVLESEEGDLLNKGIRTHSVERLIAPAHSERICSFWSYLYKDAGYSTKFVDRMPGLIVINKNKDKVQELVIKVNELKSELAKMIRGEVIISGKAVHKRTTAEKHEYIHKLFPRIMTEHLYRQVHIIPHHITNAWFNWVSRPVPKKQTIVEAKAILYNNFNRPNVGFLLEEWNQQIDLALEKLVKEDFEYCQIEKQFKVFPVMPFKFIGEDGKPKRNTKNAITPFILLGQKDDRLPVYTDLNKYDIKDIQKKPRRLATNKTVLHEGLGLIGVKKM